MPRRNPNSRPKRPNRGTRRQGMNRQDGTGAFADRNVSSAGPNPVIVARSLPLFGYQKRVNLNYYSAGLVSTGAAAAGSYTFSCNGLYDPDITGTGGQPAGFDQMMIFFEHYTVKRARIQVVCSNVSTTNQLMFGLMVSPDATAITNYERLVENGTLVGTLTQVAGVYGSVVKLSKNVSMSKFLGIRDLMSNSLVRGDVASNPSEQCYFQILCWNPYGVGVSSNNNFQVLISFDAVFTERREQVVSSFTRRGKLLPPIVDELKQRHYDTAALLSPIHRDLNEDPDRFPHLETDEDYKVIFHPSTATCCHCLKKDCLGRPLNGISDSMAKCQIKDMP